MNQNLAIPAAIVIAGILIAGALFFSGRTANPLANNQNPLPAGDPTLVPKINENDHVLGNPDAPIVIIEYSDIECPYCKIFHMTMKQIMDEYGQNGTVAWVYRNYPIQQLHPNAPALAEAAECVASLGGNATYWNFLDEIFAIAPVNIAVNPPIVTYFPMDRLPEAVSNVGVDVSAFNTCVASGEMRAKIEKDFNDAVATGGEGTPHNIIVTKAGSIIPIAGAMKYTDLKDRIEIIIREEGY